MLVPGSYVSMRDSIKNQIEKQSESISFILPFEQIEKYAELFKELEKDSNLKLKIVLTNLEEAFLNFSKVSDSDPEALDAGLDDSV